MSHVAAERISKMAVSDVDAVVFNRGYYRPKRPLHIAGTTRAWKAAQWSADYLKSVVGQRLVDVSLNEQGLFDYNGRAPTGVVLKKRMPLEQALGLICSEAGRNYYIQQLDIKKHLPELLVDLALPHLIDRWKVVLATNLWISGKGCKTPLHFDSTHNFLVQIKGRKNVMLFHPDQGLNLYPALDDVLPHCSRVNVFAPDAAVFPLYAKAEEHKIEVCLDEGDILYIPTGWWHAVESLEVSISVNFWWRGVT